VTSTFPPVLIVHGTDDSLIPLDQSLSLAETLARKGVPHRLVTVDDARHGFGIRVGARDLVPDILAFLEGVWGGPEVGIVPGQPSRRS
jgi:dipeptidyl aminopeptidase/acylaminoacyl peptidase